MPFTRTIRRTAATALVAATLTSLSFGALAQGGYPTKPIRVIVPFAAGSTTDIIARAIADKMGQSMGQTLVVDNRSGASGTIGQQAVATAAPDGYTVMIHSSSHTVSPSTFAKLPFDTVGDFAGITPISSLPNALVISPAKGIKTLQELVAAAKAKPGTINFASAGQGSATHLNAEKFKMAAKIDAQNIPFKGCRDAWTTTSHPLRPSSARSRTASCWRWPWARPSAQPPCPMCPPPPRRACPARNSTSGSG